MYKIVVVPEPYDLRPLYRWRVFGPELVSAGIALTEVGAWRQARAETQKASSGVLSRRANGHVIEPAPSAVLG